jgi:hypothetical protein
MSGVKHIPLPVSLYNRLKDIMIDVNAKGNVNDFVVKCLRERLAVYDAQKEGFKLEENDEERIKRRLRELGYLD